MANPRSIQKTLLSRHIPSHHKPRINQVKPKNIPKPDPKPEPGRHIFVYNNIRTNQVIYSLTRALDNNASLRQLPFLGKKTVPAKLRKDLWQPMATIYFPRPDQGLHALRQLREFRKLHELSYSLDDMKTDRSKHELLPKKKRGKKLMDQKANSIADIAAVLMRQEEYWNAAAKNAPSGNKEGGQVMLQNVRLGETKASVGGPATIENRLLGVEERETEEVEEANTKEMGGDSESVTIRWKNIYDAEFAETWPKGVVHDEFEWNRHTAPPVLRVDKL